MYFVLTKRPGYVLFAMTPSERFAIGLADDQATAHLFARRGDGTWQIAREWKTADFSHTAFMAALRRREEPQDLSEWLALLPAELR